MKGKKSGFEFLREEAEKINRIRVFYTLKQMKIRYVTPQTIHAVQLFLAARMYGISFLTVRDFSELTETSVSSALQVLHTLGDKGILHLDDTQAQVYRFTLSEDFLSHFKKGFKKIDESS